MDATLKICTLAGRGRLYFVLFSSLNKALRSCGLLHKSCLLLRSWYVHVTMLRVTLFQSHYGNNLKQNVLSDRMSGVHHRQEMKFTLLPTQQLSALSNEYSRILPGNILPITRQNYSCGHFGFR